MDISERTVFGNALNAAMSVSRFGKPVGPDAFDLWWGMLSKYSLPLVTQALTRHTMSESDAPTPSDILDLLTEGLGYPSPEEAWNRLPKDERDGGYVCKEMMDAYGACSDSLGRGDMIPARMAFIESYKKNVLLAKLTTKKAEYFYSGPTLGTREQRMALKHEKTIEAITLEWLDPNSNAVKQVLAITSEKKPIALEDLSKKLNNKLNNKATEEGLKTLRETVKNFR